MAGLCFSVQPGVKIPPSLRNIYKELKTEYPDFNVPTHGCVLLSFDLGVRSLTPVLSSAPTLITCASSTPSLNLPYPLTPSSSSLISLARSGVLLLNTSLTVRAHQAGSHSKLGWEDFTNKVVDLVAAYGGSGEVGKESSG